jgi:hypothetical protein
LLLKRLQVLVLFPPGPTTQSWAAVAVTVGVWCRIVPIAAELPRGWVTVAADAVAAPKVVTAIAADTRPMEALPASRMARVRWVRMTSPEGVGGVRRGVSGTREMRPAGRKVRGSPQNLVVQQLGRFGGSIREMGGPRPSLPLCTRSPDRSPPSRCC